MPMHHPRVLLKMPGALVASLAILFLLAGCGNITDIIGGGSTANDSHNSGSTNTANCPPMGRPGATSVLKSVDGNALVLVDTQGQSTKATYDANTRFTRQVKVDTSAIKQGVQLSIFVKQNQDSTLTATRIVLGDMMGNPGTGSAPDTVWQQTGTPPSSMGTPPFGNCFSGRDRGQNQGQNQDQNRNQAGNPQGNTNQGRPLWGTVDHLNNNTLTITDMNSKSYTITIGNSTAIVEMQNASASDLQTGENVSISGQPGQSNQSANQNSTIAARQITILPARDLPTEGTPAGK